MTHKAEHIITEALELNPTTRAFIAEKLIESLDLVPAATLSPEWKEEIRKRCQEIDDGTAVLRGTEAIFKKAFAALT